MFNPAGYASPAVDELIEDGGRCHDAMTRWPPAVRAIDRIMRATYFVVPSGTSGKYWLAYYDMYEHPDELPPYALG